MQASIQPRNEATSPRFTVVIPCWNAAATLHETLQSLLAQDCESWEAIIIDDGSSDETLAIIEEYCAKDTRIRAIKQSRKGPSAARNTAGISLARGEFIAFLDSDDVWSPQKLSRVLERFEERPDVDGLYAQIAFFRVSAKAPETYSTVYKRRLLPIDFLRDNPVCTMSNLVVRARTFKALHGFDETIVHNEDVEFLVRATASGAVVEGIDACLVNYRTSLTGLSADLEKMRAGWYRAIQSLQNTPYRLSKHEIAAADAGNLRYLARRALRTGAPGCEALRLALRGIVRSPQSFFSPLWRGSMTFLGALAAPLLPPALRRLAFSR